MKAWNPHSGTMLYFRPMSLHLAKKFMKMDPKPKYIPIVPNFDEEDISATIDGAPVKVLAVHRVNEKAKKGESLDGYLIQLENPNPEVQQEACLTLSSKETGEKGMGCVHFNGTHHKL